MSAAVGGSIESLSINGRTFPVAADAAAKRKLGGFENAVESNGDGSARILKTRVPWSLEGVVVEVSDDRADQEFLQGTISDGLDFFPITITFASGATFQGKGIITDEIAWDSSKTTAELKLAGPANMTAQ